MERSGGAGSQAWLGDFLYFERPKKIQIPTGIAYQGKSLTKDMSRLTRKYSISKVCVNSTSSTLSLSPPADYRVPGAVFSGHLGAAVSVRCQSGDMGVPLLLHRRCQSRL
jgi:hypothetical protein